MKQKLFSFSSENTYIHRLSGLTKLICFLIMTFAAMFSYDLRVLGLITAFAFYLFYVSKISMRQVAPLFIYLLTFMAINAVLSFLFDPMYGVNIYGTRHDLIQFSEQYVLTSEQLFYQLSKTAKYISIIPLGLIFFCTTHPSEFAASLSRIKVPYKGAYAVSLTLRYFPDIQRQFMEISQAQQARGLDMSKKEKLFPRLKNMLMVLSPLIFSTLDRVELIGNAMDLRGFGKHRTRSWYTAKSMKKADYLAIFVSSLFLVLSLIMIVVNGSRFYNPFM